jgi:hypothetical protein
MDTQPLLLIACPDVTCGATAEIVDQFDLWSTDGDIAHARTQCVHDHVFTLPTERLTRLDTGREVRHASG